MPSTIKHGPGTTVPYTPRRFYYATGEISANGANVAAAVARQGPDNFATAVWWDSKPSAAPTYVNTTVCTGG